MRVEFIISFVMCILCVNRWPPNLGEMLEIAQEITEEADSEFLEGDVSKSLDGGLDNLLSNEDEVCANVFERKNISTLVQ